jgi:hypothetical protein
LRVLRRILRLNGVVAAPDCDDDSHKTNADIPLSDHVAPNAQKISSKSSLGKYKTVLIMFYAL